MTDEEAGIQMIKEDLGGREVRVDLKIGTGLVTKIEVRREFLIAESQDIL